MPKRVLLIGGVLGVLVVSLLAVFLVASAGSDSSGAQPVRRVGLMHVGLDHVPKSLDGITDGLEQLGWVDGENIELIWRNLDKTDAEGQAKAFVFQGVDVIVAFEDTSIRAAQKATIKSRTPIVFLHPSDPVRYGLVETLASPGFNLTGVFGARDLVARHLELYTQVVPGLERVLALVDPEDPGTEFALEETKAAARRLGVELVIRETTEAADIQKVFGSLRREVDAVMLLSSTLRLNHTALTLRLAKRAGLPVQAHRKDWVEQGALFSYGSDLYPIGAAGARYVDSILDGTDPSELAVQEIPDVEFALNLATARRLGIQMPRPKIVEADVV
ncbi:MAG: ABC transporter substrate-binding protein, partial [Actinobacteria bacterium]|nr:ABC transporter substrate-binding protein [Actinomycetota bacterium]